jgi:hypothetical protein
MLPPMQRHWDREPAPSTLTWVASTPLMPTKTGLKMVLEVTAYRDDKVHIALSKVEGSPRQRTIKQVVPLMFNNMDEAKDALDELADHLSRQAATLDQPLPGDPASA